MATFATIDASGAIVFGDTLGGNEAAAGQSPTAVDAQAKGNRTVSQELPIEPVGNAAGIVPAPFGREDAATEVTHRWWALGALAVACGLLFMPLNLGYRAVWIGALQDACHVPLFGGVTYVLGRWCWPRRVFVIVLLMALIAFLAEVVQPWVGRSASLRDLLFGCLGIAAAWIALQHRWSMVGRIVLTAIVVAWPAERTLPLLGDAIWSWASFPIIAGDRSPWEVRRWRSDAGLKVSHDPDGLRLSYAGQRLGNRAMLWPVVRDWSAFQALEVEFEFAGEPQPFLIAIRDRQEVPPEASRFNLRQTYEPGRHTVRIALSELASGGDGAYPPIDLSRIDVLILVPYSRLPRDMVLRRIELLNLPEDQTQNNFGE